jgi:hypothetical protein
MEKLWESTLDLIFPCIFVLIIPCHVASENTNLPYRLEGEKIGVMLIASTMALVGNYYIRCLSVMAVIPPPPSCFPHIPSLNVRGLIEGGKHPTIEGGKHLTSIPISSRGIVMCSLVDDMREIVEHFTFSMPRL